MRRSWLHLSRRLKDWRCRDLAPSLTHGAHPVHQNLLLQELHKTHHHFSTTADAWTYPHAAQVDFLATPAVFNAQNANISYNSTETREASNKTNDTRHCPRVNTLSHRRMQGLGLLRVDIEPRSQRKG